MLLSGEAGIGKSRLTAALLERLATEPHTRLRYFCSPQHTDSALYPIISQMERAAGLAHDDAAQAKLGKLDALLVKSFTPRQDAALFAEMLSLPNDGRYPTLEVTPQQRRPKTLEALTAQMEALSRSNPLLMIFEDVHWIDPTSLEALGRAIDRIRSLGVLLIVTYRPEFEPLWIGRPHVTALTINRLGVREIAAMIDRVTGSRPLPPSIRDNIIERTDGIPLFVEEMTKAVVEAESEGRARQTVAAVPFSSLAVPASLHASLMARLDRLGAAKEVAQIAAAIGREFSHTLLAAVLRKPEAELRSALDRLIEAGLLFLQGVPPYATYLFKHALVQDAAYGTLLREPRRAIHARIAETIESQFAEIAENQPELLARHCAEAGLIEKAAGLWGKAGQRSQARSALMEAAAQFNRALEHIAGLPATTALRREEIGLQVALINPLMHVRGYAAPETKAAEERALALIERAAALGEPVEDPLLMLSVKYGIWNANAIEFNADAVLELGAEFLRFAEQQGTTVALMIGHRVMGMSLLYTGEDIARSREHLDRAIAFYHPTERAPLETRFSVDVGVSSFANRSWVQWLLGYPDHAVRDAEIARRRASEIGHAATFMYALAFASWAHLYCRSAATNVLVDELITLADEKGSLYWKAVGMVLRGCGKALTSKSWDGVETIVAGITAFRSTGATMLTPMFSAHLATAYLEFGKFDDAWRCVEEAMTAVAVTKERWLEAEVLRIAGEIVLTSAQQDAAKAQAYFERALTVARAQKAKSLELRAAMSMARLWRDQGMSNEARDLLAPVYGWFTEGFDTLDLKEAKALLDDLSEAVLGKG